MDFFEQKLFCDFLIREVKILYDESITKNHHIFNLNKIMAKIFLL